MATQAQPVGRKVPWYRYPGWWAAATGGFHGLITFSIILYGWSIFVAAFRREFGWSAAALGISVSVVNAVRIPASSFGGWLTDKAGPRYASIVSFIIIAVGWVLIAQVGNIKIPDVAEVPGDALMLALAYGVVLGWGYNGGNYRQSYPAVNRFFERRRTLGMGLIATGSGIGNILLLASLAFFVEALGWRTAALLIGIVVFGIVGIITSFGFVTHPPERYGLLRDNMTPEEAAQRGATRAVAQVSQGAMEGFTERQILRTPAFWLITLGLAFGSIGGTPLTAFQNVRLQAVGYSLTEAALFYSAQFVFQLIGRFGIAVVGDRLVARFPVRLLYALGYTLAGVGILFFALAAVDRVLFPWLWAVFYGLGIGMIVPLLGVISGEYFGRASFGFAYGSILGFSGVTAFIAPVLLGWLRDISGDWLLAFMVGVVGYALAVVVFLLATPPQAPKAAAAAEPQRA